MMISRAAIQCAMKLGVGEDGEADIQEAIDEETKGLRKEISLLLSMSEYSEEDLKMSKVLSKALVENSALKEELERIRIRERDKWNNVADPL